MIMSALKWAWVTALYGVEEKEIISLNTQHSTRSKVSQRLCWQIYLPARWLGFLGERNESCCLKLWRSCLMNVFGLSEDWFLPVYEWKMYAGWKACWCGQTKCLRHQATRRKSHNRLPGIHMADYKKVSIKGNRSLCVQVLLRTGLTPMITHSQSLRLVSSPIAASNKTSRQPHKRFSAVPLFKTEKRKKKNLELGPGYAEQERGSVEIEVSFSAGGLLWICYGYPPNSSLTSLW